MDTLQLARISKALADPTRLRIYERIVASGDSFCGEIVEREGLAPGTVSHHLKVLADAGLIESRREGQFIYNRPLPDTIREYTAALAKLSGSAKVDRKR